MNLRRPLREIFIHIFTLRNYKSVMLQLKMHLATSNFERANLKEFAKSGSLNYKRSARFRMKNLMCLKMLKMNPFQTYLFIAKVSGFKN